MSNEVIHLKDAAVKAFLKSIKRPYINQFNEPHFFVRIINVAIQYGGMEPGDIADLMGVAGVSVRQWKEWKEGSRYELPRSFMRQALCHEIVSVLTEAIEQGVSTGEILDKRFEHDEST